MDYAHRASLPRPRLDRVLDQILQYPLTIVRAPMGFGKTTAIRAYLRKRAHPSIYLSLLGDWNSTSYFWERLTARISQWDSSLGNQLVQLGFPKNGGTAAKVLELLLRLDIPIPFCW